MELDKASGELRLERHELSELAVETRFIAVVTRGIRRARLLDLQEEHVLVAVRAKFPHVLHVAG